MTDPTRTSEWERLADFARRRDAVDPLLVRAMLAKALASRGFVPLLANEDRGATGAKPSRVPGVLAILVLWGLAVALTAVLGWSWYLVPASLVAVALITALVSRNESTMSGVLLLLSWVGAAGWLAVDEYFSALAAGYIGPVGVAILYAIATRLLRLRDGQDVTLAVGGLVKAAPLLAPIVLLVLFLPALSEDVWRVAGTLDPRSIAALGVLTVGLLFCVVRVQLGRELEATISNRAQRLCLENARSSLTRQHLAATLSDEDFQLVESVSDSRLDSMWPDRGEEYAPYLHAAVGSSLLAPLTGRLAVTVGAVAVVLSGYVYLLCTAVVPITTAAEWSDSSTPFTTLTFLGPAATLAGGPFLKISVLLGLMATATFLSFALVEERFAIALNDALLRDPTDRCLALAMPYVKLTEDGIRDGWRRQTGTDREEHPRQQVP